MIRLFVLMLLLAGCVAPGVTPVIVPTATPAPITAQGVVDMFVAAGLELSDVEPGTRRDDSPMPNSYREHLRFVIPEVAPRGAQLFVCDEKYLCDSLYEYFVLMKALAGPYAYQSAGGTVVILLDSRTTPDTAERFQEIIESIK